MKISKITKFLPVALALSLTMSSVNAEVTPTDNQITSGDVVYSLVLKDYVRITNESSKTTATGEYDANYAGMSLTGDVLTANFKVITNDPRTVILSAPSSASTAPSALYGYDPDNHSFHLVFVNTSVGEVDATSVTNITSKSAGNSTPKDSPNAFAVKFEKETVATTHNLGDTTETLAITGVQGANTGDGTSGTSGSITFTIQNGVSTLNFNANTRIMEDTFNTRDREGTYQAKLILTNGAVL
mgnify:CR=1 FL=1